MRTGTTGSAEYADEHGDRFDRIIAVDVEKDKVALRPEPEGLNGPRRAVYESPADKDAIEALYAKHGTKYTAIPADL